MTVGRTNRLLAALVVVVLISGFAVAGVVRAQQDRAYPGHRMQGGNMAFGVAMFFNHIAQQLELTDQQKLQIRDIVRAHKDDIKQLIDNGFAAHMALQKAVARNDDGEIAAAARGAADVQLRAAKLRAAIRGEVFNNVLTPPQRAKADQMLSSFEQKADAWRVKIEQALDSL